jgi:hypothetical protein
MKEFQELAVLSEGLNASSQVWKSFKDIKERNPGSKTGSGFRIQSIQIDKEKKLAEESDEEESR